MGAPRLKNAAADSTGDVAETLLQYDFFRRFPKDLLRQLALTAHYRVVAQGDVLLEQGKPNSNLYILVSGALGVIVDGAKVTELNTPGDLIGEMSVINQKECSATIRAETDVEVYGLNAEDLHRTQGPDQDRIQHLLFRIYSQVLASRLELTNQKAKQLEGLLASLELAQKKLADLNRDLELKVVERTAELVKRNDEVMASHRKLEELYTNRAVTMNQLQSLYHDHLLPLKESFAKGARSAPEDEKIQRELARALHLLEPITRLYSTELAMRSQKVLLIDSNRKQQISAKMALAGTGVELSLAQSPEDAAQLIASESFDILFVDPAHLNLVEGVLKRNPKTRIVLMTSTPITEYLQPLLKLSFMPNVVSRSDEDRMFTIKNILTTVTKLASLDVFGLEKYLSWGVEVQERQVTASDQRKGLIEEMTTYFENLGLRRSNRERAAMVAEEILMNAIYDAPVDKHGKSLYNHLPRTTRVELKPEQAGKFRYACDGMLAAVSIEDPFGALTGGTILKYLQSCYGGAAGSLNSEKGGAGRGLHQIVENSDLVVFNLNPGRRTEVIALFNVDPKANPVNYPSFHLFSLG